MAYSVRSRRGGGFLGLNFNKDEFNRSGVGRALGKVSDKYGSWKRQRAVKSDINRRAAQAAADYKMRQLRQARIDGTISGGKKKKKSSHKKKSKKSHKKSKKSHKKKKSSKKGRKSHKKSKH
jgi:hypothetical protein